MVACAPLALWASISSPIACALTSGTSPLRISTGASSCTGPAWASTSMPAAVAPPVPFGRGCTASFTASGSTPARARSGESTTITLSAPASRAARTGHSTIGRPQISCSTFGVADRIRVPWPAARIRTVGALTAGDPIR